MAKKYKGSLTLEWFNKQKAIVNLDDNSIHSEKDTPAPRINWINKDEALYFEIYEEEGKGSTPYWVDRNDIRVKEARPLAFKEAYIAIEEDKKGTLPNTVKEFKIEIVSNEKEANEAKNMLIKGDNLLALVSLQKRFNSIPDNEKVKLVFIDPPYNIGSAFEHYDDNLEHSEWLTLLRDRAVLLRDLISNTGSMWVVLDEREVHYAKVLLDDVFGRENFISTIVWQKVFAKKNKALISGSHDTILVYAKDIESFDRNLLPRDDKQLSAFKNLDNDSRGVWQSVAFSVQSEDSEKRIAYRYDIQSPSGISFQPPKGRHWNGLPDRTKELIDDNRLWFGSEGNKRPRIKVFLHEVKQGIVPDTWWDKESLNDDLMKEEIYAMLKQVTHEGSKESSWWNHKDSGNNQEAKKEMLQILPNTEPFSTPKPERLIQRVIQIATNENEIVLDCFAGSGTTLAVAHKMNRKWIGIEIGDHADSHIIPRLKGVIDGSDNIGVSKSEKWSGGGSFKYFYLGQSIISIDEETGKGEFNWKLGKKFIQESLLTSYDFGVLEGFELSQSKLFNEKEKPAFGKFNGSSGKSVYGMAILASPDDDNLSISNDDFKVIYKTLKQQEDFQSLVIYTNKGIDLAEDSVPDDLDIIKVPHAIFNALER